MKVFYFYFVLLLPFVFILYACATTPLPDEEELNIDNTILVEAYKISVDDQVKVNVWGNPELSISMPVRPDGKITMPLVGDVLAAGKEPEELSAEIKEKLSLYVRNPNVSVILTELRGHEFLSRIRVTGAVENSISISYRQGMTVLDAVLEAGGVNEYAAPNRTKLHRRSESGTQVFNIKLDDILEDGDLKTNVRLRPGDVISIPERFF